MEDQGDTFLVVGEDGRQFIGELLVDGPHTITLKNPMLIIERVVPSQDGNNQIILNFSPIMHTFNIDTWEFRWSGKHRVIDEQLLSSYEKFLTQIRAARSGIQISNGVPDQMKVPLNLVSN